MTDNKGVKLTVQEAVSEGIVRNIAILPWRVIDRLNLSSGDMETPTPVQCRPAGAKVKVPEVVNAAFNGY
jgi:hypothetical protein